MLVLLGLFISTSDIIAINLIFFPQINNSTSFSTQSVSLLITINLLLKIILTTNNG
jgi:hypothetical protein